jgi:CubicO group peptidase (beta-lactamase class C family)
MSANGPRANCWQMPAGGVGEQVAQRKLAFWWTHAWSTGDVPGVVAMATDRTSVTYEGAFGKRIQGQPAPMTVDTVGWIASMTKALTGAAAMQLVEQGKLDLDAPAARIVRTSPRRRCWKASMPGGSHGQQRNVSQ